MRRVCILTLLLIGSNTLFAQKKERASLPNDRKEIDGYIIQIRPAPGATFLFDILKNGQLVYHQNNNPFTLESEGFEKRGDAFNVAEWLIKECKITQHFPPSVPPHVADLYKIKINRGARPNQN